ncbi:MAG: hypothetical protein ABSH06_21910 [Thermodesulfobacteriota bacterium]
MARRSDPMKRAPAQLEQKVGSKIRCPTCGESATELWLCQTVGCTYAKRSGCLLHFSSTYLGMKCANEHLGAKRTYPRE